MTALDQIRDWAIQQDWLRIRAVIVVGFSNCKPWEVLRQFRPDLSVIVFEPDQRKAEACSKTLPAEGEVKTGLVTHLVDLRTLTAQFVTEGYRCEVMGEPSMHGRWGPLALSAVEQGRRFAHSMELTSRLNAVKWTEIGLEVLPELVGNPAINSVGRCLEGVPGVIVGAGPSLSRNIETLARIQDRVCIVATNSALGPLEDAGVQPDLVAVVESQGTSVEPVLGSPLWERAVAIPGIHAHPGVWGVPARRFAPGLQSVGPVGSWLCRLLSVPPIHTGGSVSTMAFRVTELLGCSPLVLVGMDCARGPAGEDVYADGVRHGHIRKKLTHDPLWEQVPAWGGIGQVKSLPCLSSYREWFEARGRNYYNNEQQTQLLNATEGGAHIDGWEDRRLRDVPLPAPVDVAARLDEALDQVEPFSREQVCESLVTQKTQASLMAAEGRKLLEAATELLEGIPRLIEAGESGRIMTGYIVGPIQEAGLLPSEPQVKVMRDMFARTVEGEGQLNAMIDRALEKLARMEKRHAA